MNGFKRKSKGAFPARWAYLLLLPTIIFIGVLILWPVIETFSLSILDYSPLKPGKTEYIGVNNFIDLFRDERFLKSLWVSIQYTVIVVAIQFILGLILAVLMREMKHLKGFYRAAVFSPWAVSGVLVAVMWSMLFNGSFGAINDILMRLGLIKEAIPWGSTASTAFVIIIVASVWRGIPYFTISFLAALTSIPQELYESGRIDGGGAVKLFFKITLPYLRETIIFTTLLRFIWTFNDADVVYALTNGGPNDATLTLPVYLTRTAVEYMDFGYGSALTIALFAILLVFTLIYMQFGKSNDDFLA